MATFSRMYLTKTVALSFAPLQTQALRIMADVPVSKTLFDITEGMKCVDKNVITNGKKIFDHIKNAYGAIAELAILMKSPQVTALPPTDPVLIRARTQLLRCIDSIGIAHAGVVARLSETMLGVLEKNIQESNGSEFLSENATQIVRYYVMVMMREFPKKGHEIMAVLGDFYAVDSTPISLHSAQMAVPLFEEIRSMWKSPLYYHGNMAHIHALNETLQTAARTLGVTEKNSDPCGISPHVVLLADAINALKFEVGANDPTPAFTTGSLEHRPEFFESGIGIVNAHFQKEPNAFKKMGAAATWELTANFRAAFLGQLMIAAGVTERLGQQPLYIPVHIPSEEEPYTAQDSDLLTYTPEQELSFIEGSAYLTEKVMIPFYVELQSAVMAEVEGLSQILF